MPIVLRGVYSGYMRGDYVLKNVNMDISSHTLILGPNGSGKTTLFRTIIGVTPIAKGSVEIDGLELEKIKGVTGLISTNLPEIYIGYTSSSWELASLYLDLMNGDQDKFKDLARAFNIAGELVKKPHHLSAGTRVLFYDLLALSMNTKYVLLDEPFESVDPAKRSMLLKEILSVKSTIVLNTHTTWLIKHMNEWSVYLMIRGRLYGPVSTSELLSSKISQDAVSDAVLEIKLGEKTVYLSRSSGIPLSNLDSLDKLYEVLTW